MRRAEDSLSSEALGSLAMTGMDWAWIARVRQGDEAAAHALVERLRPKVMKLVNCYLPRRSSGEDMAQAVFLKIFKHLHQFSGLVPLEHWVARVAINTCLNELRLESHRPELRMADFSEEDQFAIEQLHSTDSGADQAYTKDASELLRKLMAGLTPDERMIIQSLHLDGRTTREISRKTGWSISSVKVKAFRARRKLRKLWRQISRRPRAA
jgi:RNA polymerase sigma factor (sigma-70 family)